MSRGLPRRSRLPEPLAVLAAGAAGLWTRADPVTDFDDLSAAPPGS